MVMILCVHSAVKNVVVVCVSVARDISLLLLWSAKSLGITECLYSHVFENLQVLFWTN